MTGPESVTMLIVGSMPLAITVALCARDAVRELKRIADHLELQTLEIRESKLAKEVECPECKSDCSVRSLSSITGEICRNEFHEDD